MAKVSIKVRPLSDVVLLLTLLIDGPMKLRNIRDALLQQEDLNFLLTNRVPRALLTRFMGWFSKIRNPLVSRASIGVWRLFTDLDLSDARKTSFDSLHDCFTRELRPGARPIDADPNVFVSPCDGIVGACGTVDGVQVFQAKGFPYSAAELFGDAARFEPFRDGCYATLRLTSSMYHRFHAPHDGRVEHVTYLSGDTWNVNPIALARVERLFCLNERAVIETRLDRGGHRIALVPVAAILVASIRLHFLDVLLHLRYAGPNRMPCDAAFRKGDELGWFEHGSTIIVFAPRGFQLAAGVAAGTPIRMGQPLMTLPTHDMPGPGDVAKGGQIADDQLARLATGA
jgi:phosphatidylserine decarboxylase